MKRKKQNQRIVLILLISLIILAAGIYKSAILEEAEIETKKETKIKQEETLDLEKIEFSTDDDGNETEIVFGEGCIFTEEEKIQLQKEAVYIAEQCMDFYKDVEIITPNSEYSYIKIFTDEQRTAVLEQLARQGVICISDGINMQNNQGVYQFYQDYCDKKNGMVTIVEVDRDGELSAMTFLHREGQIQTYHIRIGWQQGGIPKIRTIVVNDLAELKLTEKGYLIYMNMVTGSHSNLRESYRVSPLSDQCREFTKKYLYGLSYVNYNMLTINWDSQNVEDILMPCMFQDIYRIYTGKNFRAEQGNIPAEICEQVMTTCFPISVEQLRKIYHYNADTDSYEYEIILSKQFPPFAEVVDYKKNIDGTITLMVDGVWIDYNSDCAFRNQIVIQPLEDGRFRYLSNSIEAGELQIPEIP